MEIGKKPEKSNKKYYYKATSLPGVLRNPYPFKVTQFSGGTDWGLTLYLKHPCSDKMQKDIEFQIREWFNQPKDLHNFPGINDSWISDFEWRSDKVVGWWVSGRSGPAAMFNDLFKALSGFSDIIDELIIGLRFPDRQKIDYTI